MQFCWELTSLILYWIRSLVAILHRLPKIVAAEMLDWARFIHNYKKGLCPRGAPN
jgi:hypothetical protein